MWQSLKERSDQGQIRRLLKSSIVKCENLRSKAEEDGMGRRKGILEMHEEELWMGEGKGSS